MPDNLGSGKHSSCTGRLRPRSPLPCSNSQDLETYSSTSSLPHGFGARRVRYRHRQFHRQLWFSSPGVSLPLNLGTSQFYKFFLRVRQKPLIRVKPTLSPKGDGKRNQCWKERSSEAPVTDGALQKVNPWLLLLFIIY